MQYLEFFIKENIQNHINLHYMRGLPVLLLILIGCQHVPQDERVVLTQVHSVVYLTEVRLDLFEVSITLHPLLDSIIETTTNCQEYYNQQLGFELLFYGEDRFIIANIVDLNFQYYLIYDGIFYYKGYQFGIVDLVDSPSLKKLNRKITLYSISKEKYPYVYIDESKNSYWTYRYKDDVFECIEIKRCGKFFKLNNHQSKLESADAIPAE